MSDNNKPTEHDPAKVWNMVKQIDISMFVTRNASTPRGRPMSTIGKPEENVIYLLTEATSSAAQDVASDEVVLLSYQSQSDHLSISGVAEIDPDKALVERLWSPGAQAFWPEGPVASNVVAIRVRPGTADYWDGPNPVVGAAKFVFGLVTGNEPEMGDRGVVNL